MKQVIQYFKQVDSDLGNGTGTMKRCKNKQVLVKYGQTHLRNHACHLKPKLLSSSESNNTNDPNHNNIDTIEINDSSDYCPSSSTTIVTESNENNQKVVDIEDKTDRDFIQENDSGNLKIKGSSGTYLGFSEGSGPNFRKGTNQQTDIKQKRNKYKSYISDNFLVIRSYKIRYTYDCR